jgi:thiamine-phosphate pyrophosphorylase
MMSFLGEVYLVSGSQFDPGPEHLETIEKALKAGVSTVQIREKHLEDKELYNFSKQARAITNKYKALLIIDDRPDIAKLVCADGVHIGQEDLSVEQVRSIIGAKGIVGKSTHSIEQALQAEQEGADYIGVGPVYPTNSKKGVCASVGVSLVREVAERISIPFVAIGGIKHNNIRPVIEAGAKSIAVITGIVSAPDPYQAALDYVSDFSQ